MYQILQNILMLEDSNQFDRAFYEYKKIYSENKGDYEIWKHFYFFLWTAIEDAPSDFNDKINLRHLLRSMLEESKQSFSEMADFNFIAGYTVSIFPYEYGDFEDFEKQANQMLLKATEMQPENIIYKMVYLGNISKPDNQLYRQTAKEAAAKVLETFSGDGTLNKYFKQVLYRTDEKNDSEE